ncbi:MAG: ParB N-terminal domain-containing protein [bacterium]
MDIIQIDSGFEQIPIERIDLQDKIFAVAYPQDVDEHLTASVRDAGLFIPVVLESRQDRLFRIVSGGRRIPAAKAAGLNAVTARITGQGVGDKSLFLWNIRENAAIRALNHMEKSLVLHRLTADFGAGEQELLELMPLLGLEPARQVLYQYSGLARLNHELRRYLIVHGIPVKVGSRMAAWSPADQDALCGFLRTVQMGGNTLNEVVELLEEIALRDRMKIADVLMKRELRNVLQAPGFTSTQKKDRLKRGLIRMRYPGLWERTQRISELLAKGGRVPGVTIEPPPYLEGIGLDVSFSFRSAGELRDKAERLAALSRQGEIGQVLSLLQQKEER